MPMLPPESPRSSWLPGIVAVGGLLLTALAGNGVLPIGVSGQWTYGLYPYDDVPPRFGLLWVPAIGLGILLLVLRSAWRRLESPRGWLERAGWLLLVLLGGEGYTTGLILTSRAGAGEPCLIAWSEWAGGFFNDGRRMLHVPDAMAAYPDLALRMSPHGRTHPPGSMMVCRTVLAACERRPEGARRIEEAARRIAPEAVEIPMQEAPWPRALPIPPLAPWGRTALLLIAWGTVWGAAIILVPLFALGRMTLGPHGDREALVAAALFTVSPAIAFFAPWMDLLYPLFSVSAAAFVAVALSTERRAIACGGWLLAGSCVALGLLFTFAHLVTVAFLFAWAVCEAVRRGRGVLRPLLQGTLWGTAGVAVVWGAIRFSWGYDAFRDVLFRTSQSAVDWKATLGTELHPYLPWLWGNLVEFSAFLGWPTFLAFLAATAAAARRLRARTATMGDSLTLGLAMALFALDLSGMSRSEAGRLWLFLMPLAALCAARLFAGRLQARLLILCAVALQGMLFKLMLTTNNLIN